MQAQGRTNITKTVDKLMIIRKESTIIKTVIIKTLRGKRKEEMNRGYSKQSEEKQQNDRSNPFRCNPSCK
jgi:hypothetical protein